MDPQAIKDMMHMEKQIWMQYHNKSGSQYHTMAAELDVNQLPAQWQSARNNGLGLANTLLNNIEPNKLQNLWKYGTGLWNTIWQRPAAHKSQP